MQHFGRNLRWLVNGLIVLNLLFGTRKMAALRIQPFDKTIGGNRKLGIFGSVRAGKNLRQLAPTPVRVYVYNFAGVPHRELQGAEMNAARIFKQAGVQMLWLDCPLTRAESELNSECDGTGLWTSS